jgi:hypothetical protein
MSQWRFSSTENTGCKIMVDKDKKPEWKEVTANVEFSLEITEHGGVGEKDLKHLLEDATGPNLTVEEVEFDDP